jgi:hypothetical protein
MNLTPNRGDLSAGSIKPPGVSEAVSSYYVHFVKLSESSQPAELAGDKLLRARVMVRRRDGA